MVALVSADQCPCRDHSFVQHGSRNGLGYETSSQSSKKKVAKIQDWARTPYGDNFRIKNPLVSMAELRSPHSIWFLE